MRWDLIEKFEVIKRRGGPPGRPYARAVKDFTGTEDFFKENFPGKPLVPEPLFIEMVAQTGGVLYGLGFDFKKEVILAKIERARFERPVAPPCEFVIEAVIEEEREEGAWISGTVRLGREIVAEAKILLVTMDELENVQRTKKIVFNDGFLKHYDIENVAKVSEALL